MMMERPNKKITKNTIFDAQIWTRFFSNMMQGSSSFNHGDNVKALDDCISNMTHIG